MIKNYLYLFNQKYAQKDEQDRLKLVNGFAVIPKNTYEEKKKKRGEKKCKDVGDRYFLSQYVIAWADSGLFLKKLYKEMFYIYLEDGKKPLK